MIQKPKYNTFIDYQRYLISNTCTFILFFISLWIRQKLQIHLNTKVKLCGMNPVTDI